MIRGNAAQGAGAGGMQMPSSPEPGWGSGRAPVPLAGATVLLAEDEAFLALDLHDSLEEAGARVIGPVASLSDALAAADAQAFDAAILDIDLQGKEVLPVASILADKQIPFLFHTAHGHVAQFAPDFAQVPICSKPTDPSRLIRILRELLDRSHAN